MARRLRVEADGGSRGNPGVAGYGALVRDAATGDLLVELAEPLGTASNNVAEYRGMIAGLGAVLDLDPAADVEVAMDSKLVVEQMSGRWKIKHADMRTLALEARERVSAITSAGGSVRFTWIPRADNGDADLLSNRGMDGESVADRYEVAGERSGGEGAPAGESPSGDAHGDATRVVLVRDGGEPARAADLLAHLVGDDGRLVTWAGVDTGAAGTLAERLGVATAEQRGTALTAWREVVRGGGTVVVVAGEGAIRDVLGHVLGIPADRRDRLVLAPGSLTAVQARPDGTAVVPFVGRT